MRNIVLPLLLLFLTGCRVENGIISGVYESKREYYILDRKTRHSIQQKGLIFLSDTLIVISKEYPESGRYHVAKFPVDKASCSNKKCKYSLFINEMFVLDRHTGDIVVYKVDEEGKVYQKPYVYFVNTKKID